MIMRILRLLFCLLLVANFISCSDNEDVRTQSITSSGCKSHLNRSVTGRSEYLTYEVKSGVLIISLHNYLMHCDLTQMGAEISNENNKIVLTPKPLDGGAVNCVCPMDFTFPVAGLVSGDTYQCVVDVNYLFYSFEFICKEGEKGTINLYENN